MVSSSTPKVFKIIIIIPHRSYLRSSLLLTRAAYPLTKATFSCDLPCMNQSWQQWHVRFLPFRGRMLLKMFDHRYGILVN